MSEFTFIGQIVGTHGLRGQVKVDPVALFEDRFVPGSRFRCGDQWITLRQCAWHKGHLLVQFEEIKDPDQADTLKWKRLEVAGDAKPKLAPNEFVSASLLGLKVFQGKELIGTVDDVLPMPAHDVIVVGNTLIPAVKEFVKEVDIEHGRMIVELIEGMLEP